MKQNKRKTVIANQLQEAQVGRTQASTRGSLGNERSFSFVPVAVMNEALWRSNVANWYLGAAVHHLTCCLCPPPPPLPSFHFPYFAFDKVSFDRPILKKLLSTSFRNNLSVWIRGWLNVEERLHLLKE